MSLICRLDIAGHATWELVVMQQVPAKGDWLRDAVDEHPTLVVSRVDWELRKAGRGFDCTIRCLPVDTAGDPTVRMTLVEMKEAGLI